MINVVEMVSRNFIAPVAMGKPFKYGFGDVAMHVFDDGGQAKSRPTAH
jgi:hypothetical protein